MVDDLVPPPTLEERLQSARTRFALLAEVLDLHALGIEHMDHALGPDAARALAETCRQAAFTATTGHVAPTTSVLKYG